MHFAYWAITIYGGPFQSLQLYIRFVTPWRYADLPRRPSTPTQQRLHAYTVSVWADPISLAATLGIAIAFFSWG